MNRGCVLKGQRGVSGVGVSYGSHPAARLAHEFEVVCSDVGVLSEVLGRALARSQV